MFVPLCRYLTAKLALGWRVSLTQHLLKNYLRKNAFYKVCFLSINIPSINEITMHDSFFLTSSAYDEVGVKFRVQILFSNGVWSCMFSNSCHTVFPFYVLICVSKEKQCLLSFYIS